MCFVLECMLWFALVLGKSLHHEIYTRFYSPGRHGVYVSKVPSMTNTWLVHSVGVHYVRIGRNGEVLRYTGRDNFDGDQTHDIP